MPQSVLSWERVQALLPVPVTDAQLEDLLFSSKAELVAREGDALTVAVTPDRLDLLSEGGLALYLAGALEVAHGLPKVQELSPRPPKPTVLVDPSVETLRPFIAGLIVRPPDGQALDAGTLAEAIRFQEIVHATVGRDRRAASLGIYPWERVEPPVRYALEPLANVRFVPLDGTEEVGGAAFFREHPLAARFGAYGRDGDRCLVLRDADGAILSLPPVLNSRSAGEARTGDRELLLESTGILARSVRESLGLLFLVFAARGWAVEPVQLERPGRPLDDGRAVLSPSPVDLPSALLREVGGESFPSAEVERRLGRARLSARPHAGGWRVEGSPWRPDLMTAVDVAEDVLIAVPVLPERGVVPPSATRGRRRPEVVFRRRVALDLLGLGFAAPNTSVLVSESSVRRLPGRSPIRLTNPVSAEFAYLRDGLLLSHLEVLARNTRYGYPQRFAEVGPVIVPSAEAESGGQTRYHASLVVAADTAGFADAAAIVDYLLRRRDVLAVREPTEIGGLIPGRSARARIAGEVVAELGEIHPEVLAGLGVPVPAVWAELDLSALWPLVARHEGA
jgi:phenylalanyl-tRNA synthetase beta chain